MREPNPSTWLILVTPDEALASRLETEVAEMPAVEDCVHVHLPETLPTALEDVDGPSTDRAPIVIIDLEARGGLEALEEQADGEVSTYPLVLGLVDNGNHRPARQAYSLYANACLGKRESTEATAEALVDAVEFWTHWPQLPGLD